MKYMLFFLCLFSAHFSQGNNSISEADKFRSLGRSHKFKIYVEEEKSGEKSEFEVSISGKNSLAVQIKPANSFHRKLLMKADDLWLFVPGSKRPVRVTMEQRLVGDVSNGDILKTDFAEDYSAIRIVDRDANQSGSVEVFELKKKSEGAAYQKIKYFVDRKNHHPLKAIFYAASGKELKSAQYLKFKKVLGREICIETLITDLNTHQKTKIKSFNYDLIKFDESAFNKDALTN